MADRCQYLGGGSVRCILEHGHERPHLYRCAGRYCPGLPWIASNTPHPTSCSFEHLNTPAQIQEAETLTDHLDRLRMPLAPKL